MQLFLDHNLSRTVASALREVALDCHATGDTGCPPSTADDDEIARWCRQRGRILVTADRSRRDDGMRVALELHRPFVVQLRRPPGAVPLLRGLLNAWEAIGDASGRASRRGVWMKLNLDPETGQVSRVRKKR